MRQQMMGQQHRLGVLEVGATGHRDVDVLFCLTHQGIHHVENQRAHAAGVVAQVHPEKGGDLVVPRAAGAKPTADVSASPLDQSTFERGMDVLIVLVRYERPRLHVGQELPESAEHGLQTRVVQQPGEMQHPGVSAGPRNVVRRQPPVEVGRLRQQSESRRSVAGEAAAPQADLAHLPGTRHTAAHLAAGRVLAHAPCRRSRPAAILLDRPCSSMKPLAWLWSNVSPAS